MRAHSAGVRYLALILTLSACSASPNPFQAHALRSSERQWREGRVLERLPAGPYTYLLLREPSGRSEWLVSLRGLTPSESHVRALVVGRAERFHSKRLGRDFGPLSFAALRPTTEPSPKQTIAKEIRP